MSKKKTPWTDGPWTMDNEFGGLIRAGKVNVASVLNAINATKAQKPVPTDPDEIRANARLIAAAPAMAGLLQRMVDWKAPNGLNEARATLDYLEGRADG